MDIQKLTVALANATPGTTRETFRDAGIKFTGADDDVDERLHDVFRRLQSTLELYGAKGVDGISSMKRKDLVNLLRECNAKQGKDFLAHVFNVVRLCNCFLVFIKEHYRIE